MKNQPAFGIHAERDGSHRHPVWLPESKSKEEPRASARGSSLTSIILSLLLLQRRAAPAARLLLCGYQFS